MKIKVIRSDETSLAASLPNLHPLISKLYINRGIRDIEETSHSLQSLLDYKLLKGINCAASLLKEAIIQNRKLLIIGDFDADGATSTAVAIRALTMLGAQQVDYLIPNRFDYGYGLTPEIVDLAQEQSPDIIVTVDNGIANHDGVERAKMHGIQVVITDHHLAADTLPAADAIVNPNQPGCTFPSKSMAGVGVIFYVMLAVRAELKSAGWFAEGKIPNLAELLDIVALGTVADVVPLDQNNRILVQQGLLRIRHRRAVPGILALLELAKRQPERVVASDLGFAVGPRLNAAGRLDDMSVGVECLLSNSKERAQQLAESLQQLNTERQVLEKEMQHGAEKMLARLNLSDGQQLPFGLALFDANWHQGIIGILASRIKEKYHRPVICFSPSDKETLKGSARSIKNVHIRDVLALVATKSPDIIVKFGGHAMAAGLTIKANKLSKFQRLFNDTLKSMLTEEMLVNTIHSDGVLDANDMTVDIAELIRQAGPWGQAFPEPLFDGEFAIIEQRIVAEKHLKLHLKTGQKMIDAIAFNVDLQSWPTRASKIYACYQLTVNEFRGRRSVQLNVQHLEPILT